MTTIYQVNDPANKSVFYFVPDDATKVEGEALNIPNSVWNVGTLDDANHQLTLSQTNLLAVSSDHFSVVKSVGTDSDGNIFWAACDLALETPNTDVLYELFVDVTPGFKSAVGTEDANAKQAENNQAFLAYSNLESVITLSALPQPVGVKGNVSQ